MVRKSNRVGQLKVVRRPQFRMCKIDLRRWIDAGAASASRNLNAAPRGGRTAD
jgi:hypothetical protein